MINKKNINKLSKLCIKITNVFTDFYVFKHGYCISMDLEHPFIIQLEDDAILWFKELCGEFNLLHILDVRKFKKSLVDSIENKKDDDEIDISEIENNIYEITSNLETQKVVSLLTERINHINSHDKWENFVLSDNDEENTKLLLNLFKDNNYLSFEPSDTKDGPDIILTKSVLPLVSEKNYTDLYYSSQKIDTTSDLYLIIFDFQFSMFRLYMFHYYIPLKNK